MPEQLSLFPGVLKYRAVWTLKEIGVMKASDLIIELLNERRGPVSEFDIAKRHMNLAPTAEIPDTQAELFATLVDQIHDERYRIKATVEDLSPYKLVIVDENGTSARHNGGRRAAGFDLRDTEVGRSDDALQFRMAFGSMRASADRHPELIHGAEGLMRQLSDYIEPQQPETSEVAPQL